MIHTRWDQLQREKNIKMAFQERAIHRPDLVFLDEMMLELDDVEAENDLIEQENWEDGLVKL